MISNKYKITFWKGSGRRMVVMHNLGESEINMYIHSMLDNGYGLDIERID